jgi:hypothetical protein
MGRFRFIHAADLYVDTPCAGVGRAARDMSEALRDVSLDSFDALMTRAIARRAEVLLVAGLYPTGRRAASARRVAESAPGPWIVEREIDGRAVPPWAVPGGGLRARMMAIQSLP